MHHVIDVRHLSKSFNGKRVVSDISLQVKSGEIFGFLGPNGSGKTTTIRMLCGLLTPDLGEGTCLGYDILHPSDDLKLKIGYMTQRFSLYEDLTVYENLAFIAQVYQLQNRDQCIQRCLKDLNLQTRSAQLAGELSGGWKQRLSLAAALLPDPQLLLLDEPTAGVDPEARRQFWDKLHHLSTRGITTLVSTHYMDEAQRCHRITYVSQGKLLATGTPDQLIERSNLIVWSVTGSNLLAISEQVRNLSGVTQVNQLGDTLHICGHHRDALERSLIPLQNSDTHWAVIKPNLEEVLIDLGQSITTDSFMKK
jgi:ABC-2 type transport system ATP-binding protein